jgi:hypothetical protein
MEWFYAVGSERRGPVPQEEFDELVRKGEITPETLVWREGFEDWRPLAAVTAAPETPAPPALGALPTASCSQCGRTLPADQVIRIGSDAVCDACKPLYLQRMREGVSTNSGQAAREQLVAIARAQRGVNWCVLLVLLGYGSLFALQGAGVESVILAAPILVLLAAAILQIIYVYRLASALQVGLPILWVVAVFFLGCIGLLLLLILSSRASKRLRAAGLRVGLLGVAPRDLEALR